MLSWNACLLKPSQCCFCNQQWIIFSLFCLLGLMFFFVGFKIVNLFDIVGKCNLFCKVSKYYWNLGWSADIKLFEMSCASFSVSRTGGEACSFTSGSYINVRRNAFGIELHDSLLNRINVARSKHLRQTSYGSRCRFSISARIKKGQKHDYPWPDKIDPNLKSGHLSYLSVFKPLAEKPKPVTLDFEKPLICLVILGVKLLKLSLLSWISGFCKKSRREQIRVLSIPNPIFWVQSLSLSLCCI